MKKPVLKNSLFMSPVMMSGSALALFRRLAAPACRRLGSSGAGQEPAKGWWHSATFWGGWGAAAGWGMTGSAIYDANLKGPEIISLNMTSVMLVYSSLFARWAWVVKPQNLALCACHVSNVIAQSNQMRRAIEYKLSQGQDKEVQEMGQKAAIGAASMAALIVGGPTIQGAIVGAGLGPVRCVFTRAHATAHNRHCSQQGSLTVLCGPARLPALLRGPSRCTFGRP